MASNSSSVGGYDLNWFEEPSEGLKCLICLCVARDPHQHPGDATNDCGKVFCHDCIIEYQKSETTCPNCRQDLTLFKDSRGMSLYYKRIAQIINYLAGARDIKALKVKCSNLVNGCCWVGELGDLKTHLQSCDYALLPCTNKCKIYNNIAKFLRKDLKDHLTNHCPRRQYKCPHCQETGEHQERTTTHLEICPKFKVPCPNDQCQGNIPRCEIITHQSMCEYEPVSCKYAEVGCEKKPPRKDIQIHEENAQFHLKTIVENSLNLSKKCARYEREITYQKMRQGSSIENDICTIHVFKMDNYTRRKNNSEVFHSPPFYTPSNGYKMCARVHANGTGEAAEEKYDYLSIGICLMKGDNDDSLPWPFTGKIKFEILNLIRNTNHHKGEFIFPPDDPASQRVEDDERAETGYGIPFFMPHNDIISVNPTKWEHLKDDTLTIRVSVKLPEYKSWLECTL